MIAGRASSTFGIRPRDRRSPLRGSDQGNLLRKHAFRSKRAWRQALIDTFPGLRWYRQNSAADTCVSFTTAILRPKTDL